MRDDFLPTAPIDVLQQRAELLKAVRRFFDGRGYWEVVTPVMSRESVVDANLDPFVVEGQFFLQTSPELAMKRLLSAGAKSIYQLSPAFRRGEQGRLHNPEFTMLEWYHYGDTHHEQMDFVEELIREVSATCSFAKHLLVPEGPFRRRTYDDVCALALGTTVLDQEAAQLRELAESAQISVPESLSQGDRDGWLNLLWGEAVEPQLGREFPEFVYDYPASQAALAKINPDNQHAAERFELFINGLEICNGYHELTDANELRARVVAESNKRASAGLPALPEPRRLIAAMEAGLPESAGVALGLDRLLMIMIGAESIADVLPFPLDRA